MPNFDFINITVYFSISAFLGCFIYYYLKTYELFK